MNRLILVRHGENRANLAKEFSHHLIDYPLTAKGRLQAEQTAAYLRDYPVKQVFSSPLIRAKETAEIIAATTGGSVQLLENFRELDVGRLEAEPPSAANWQLHNEIVRSWALGDVETRFPGGENYLELLERVRSGYRSIHADRDGETLVLVAHGGSLSLPLLALIDGPGRELLRSVTHHNCAVSELDVSQAATPGGAPTFKLVRWASAGHLHGEAANFVAGTPRQEELE